MDPKGERFLLALARDGKPLGGGHGPVRLVIPGDPQRVRWVWMVASFHLVRLPSLKTTSPILTHVFEKTNPRGRWLQGSVGLAGGDVAEFVVASAPPDPGIDLRSEGPDAAVEDQHVEAGGMPARRPHVGRPMIGLQTGGELIGRQSVVIEGRLPVARDP